MIPLIERFVAVGELAVRKFEGAFGDVLPSDYFDFLCHVKGWSLAMAAVISVPGADEPVSVTNFYVVAGQWERTLEDDAAYVEPDLGKGGRGTTPKEFLVIAGGHEGRFVMDFRKEAYGQIYYFDSNYHFGGINKNPFLSREFFEERGLDGGDRYSYVKVASNFTEFVGKIELSEWSE